MQAKFLAIIVYCMITAYVVLHGQKKHGFAWGCMYATFGCLFILIGVINIEMFILNLGIISIFIAMVLIELE